MESKSVEKRRRRWLLPVVIALLLTLFVGIYLYHLIFAPFTLSQTTYLFIDREMDYEAVVQQIKDKSGLPSEGMFRLLAEKMNYPNHVKSGRYAIENGMTVPGLIRQLRSGIQTPIHLTFNNIRTAEELAGGLSRQLLIDSLSLLQTFNDSATAAAYGFNSHTFLAMFIPNTYQVYWDTDAAHLVRRMNREYKAFWNDGRRGKAMAIGLTPVEIAILASIVEEEATFADEYATIAGLYLNRLKKGMPLQADPTVKFAVGDFSLRRILFRHLEVESPYNTYQHTGLPPGPIRIPSIRAIDATLSPQQHHYLFMCAKEDLSGRHNFATTNAQHERNAAAYRQALNQRGIY